MLVAFEIQIEHLLSYYINSRRDVIRGKDVYIVHEIDVCGLSSQQSLSQRARDSIWFIRLRIPRTHKHVNALLTLNKSRRS